MSLQITICGGGNAAHTLAGLLSNQAEVVVRVYAPFGDESKRWQEGIQETGGITVNTPNRKIIGRPELVCREPGPAVTGSQLVLLALPAFAHEPILREVAPYLSHGMWVGALPARGGFDLCVRDVFGKHLSEVVVFGFQTLPWACRIEHYGKQATILGIKEQVDLAAWPSEFAQAVSTRMQELLSVKLNPVSNFLSLTLADTGQLIHPGIMYGLFRDWDGQPFDKPTLFYQGVDSSTADTLGQMSAEIQTLRLALEKNYPSLDLSAVRPLMAWLKRSYQADITDSSTLQSSFVTNRSYAGLLAPMQKTEAGFMPDFQARYLSEDVPYNLVVTRGIAELAGVATPILDQVLSWAQEALNKNYLSDNKLQGTDLGNTRCPQRYGYTSLNQLISGLQYLSEKEEYDQATK
jgi:hypothetical protein